MKKGKQYLVRLSGAPTKVPKNGGWAQIRYHHPEKTKPVSPVSTTQTPWGRSVHIFALEDGPDPEPGRDELVYRNEIGEGESQFIESFTELG